MPWGAHEFKNLSSGVSSQNFLHSPRLDRALMVPAVFQPHQARLLWLLVPSHTLGLTMQGLTMRLD